MQENVLHLLQEEFDRQFFSLYLLCKHLLRLIYLLSLVLIVSVCICLQRNMIREATSFLLDVLKPNLPEHGFLQTKASFSIGISVFMETVLVLLLFNMIAPAGS
jgi:hypothetical protein